MKLAHRTFVASIAVACTTTAFGQTATFTWLDESFSANDLTPDGKYVVGDSFSGAYIWSLDDGYTFIGSGSGIAISDDGQTVLGTINDPATGLQTAAIWTDATGWQLLGGFDSCDSSLSSGYELSADGNSATGLAWGGCSAVGFRWTDDGGMVALESLFNGNNRASVISADGTFMGGFAQGQFNRTPAIWYADGTGELLDPTAAAIGEVTAMSDDGSIVLGSWENDVFYRTEAEGVVTFPSLIAPWQGIPMDIANTGTIVGFDIQSTARQAWIKYPEQPVRLLTTYLTFDLGAPDIPTTLNVAQAISTNGRVIIGHNSFDRGWVIHLSPNPDIDLDGSVGFSDLVSMLGAWGPCPKTGDCLADLDEDGDVAFGDLLLLLSAWTS